jgi:predicted ATP-grasp superfamily ATP-dependent carboligase
VDVPDFVEIDQLPELTSPTMIAAFRGWNDAGASASLAAGYLRATAEAERFAVIDSEPFVDYQQTRPHVQLTDGQVRSIEWPVTELFVAPSENLVLLLGTEPNMRWRSYTDAVCTIARELNTKLVITLGALLADTPHTRPVPVSATGSDEELIAQLGLTRSNYEGPTGIVGVLHEACSRHDLRSASLWAATPHYITASPNPRAAVALLERLHELTGTPAPSGELRRAASEYETRVAEAIAEDEDVVAYVEQLEQEADAEQAPDGDELAKQFERYLREHGGDGQDG